MTNSKYGAPANQSLFGQPCTAESSCGVVVLRLDVRRNQSGVENTEEDDGARGRNSFHIFIHNAYNKYRFTGEIAPPLSNDGPVRFVRISYSVVDGNQQQQQQLCTANTRTRSRISYSGRRCEPSCMMALRKNNDNTFSFDFYESILRIYDSKSEAISCRGRVPIDNCRGIFFSTSLRPLDCDA